MTCYGHVNISSNLIHALDSIEVNYLYIYNLQLYYYSIDKSNYNKFKQWIFQYFYSL